MKVKTPHLLALVAVGLALPAWGQKRALTGTEGAVTSQAGKAQPAPETVPADQQSQAYYYFAVGRLYDRLFEVNYDSAQRSEYATLAIENYEKAYALDSLSAEVGERLAEMYAKSQRIRDAVLKAQEIIARDPNHLGARRLLGRIFVRTLGNLGPDAGQRETARRATEQYREILRRDPSDSESALWLARLLRLQNEHEQAGTVLRDLLARQPRNEAALDQMSQLLLDQGRAPEAVSLLENAIDDSSQGNLLLLLGDAYSQLENHARAELAYQRAVERDPKKTEPRRKLARALAAQQKREPAIEEYRRLVEADPTDAESHLRLAQLYRQGGQLEMAEESVIRARQRAPGSLEAIYTEALIYETQGRFEDSIRVLSGAVTMLKRRAAPPDQARRSLAVLYEQLSRLYRETENFTAAVSTCQEMMNLGPEEQRAGRAILVETYRAAKQLDTALAESNLLLAADAADRGAQMAHALLEADKGQTDAAVARLRGLLGGSREDREIHLTLAQVLERGRRFAEAEKAVDAAEQLSPRPAEKEIVWFLRGAIYERQKKFDVAEEQFRRALEVNPRNSGALNYFGYMLADLGVRLDEAVDLIQRALLEEPHNGSYLDSLGWAYFKQNKLDDAEKTLRRALSRNRHDPTIHDHLGDVLARQGHAEQAAAAWERSLAEWQRATPAELEPEKVAATETKLRNLKNRVAQKKPAGETKP
jgi:tetratricopeptide (TPR) repeat protein